MNFIEEHLYQNNNTKIYKNGQQAKSDWLS